MTQEAPNYVGWRPEYDGHAPPNWRDGMLWDCEPFYEDGPKPDSAAGPPVIWYVLNTYKVPVEALTAPNEDAGASRGDYGPAEQFVGKIMPAPIEDALHVLRQYPADELAKHGITLAPEKDWAVELWADLFAVRGMPSAAKSTREGRLDDEDQAAIDLIRERVVLKEAIND